ncbi:uncharacterized protein LOC134268857 [Saccostrea cucullata]|uniref:uncharacterized protein LOC134268857 n=1 Tax=Saccostrea cuccullata TaxID=36930 RepID=UPI002ED3BF20
MHTMTILKKVTAVPLVLILLINAAVIIVAILLLPKLRNHKLTVDNSILTDLERIGVHYVDNLVPVNEPLDSAFSQEVFISTISLSGIELLMSVLVLLILLKAKEGWRSIRMVLLAICIVGVSIFILLSGWVFMTICDNILKSPVTE